MSKQKFILVTRWAARITGTIIILFWGAFFMEHLKWFKDFHNLPPLKVFIMMLLLLSILIGYIAAFRFEIYGSAVAITGAVLFFYFAAGENFIIFTLITSIPAILYIICNITENKADVLKTDCHIGNIKYEL